MPRLELMLRGVKREEAGVQRRPRLPITPVVLEKLRAVWNRDAADHDNIMLRAACFLGFFGFLRSREMTAPDTGDFDPGQHLTVKDIAVDNKQNPTAISVRVKQSKTDPFRQGVSIYLGKTDTPICLVAALLSYLVV